MWYYRYDNDYFHNEDEDDHSNYDGSDDDVDNDYLINLIMMVMKINIIMIVMKINIMMVMIVIAPMREAVWLELMFRKNSKLFFNANLKESWYVPMDK